jgi:hypothetical protein
MNYEGEVIGFGHRAEAMRTHDEPGAYQVGGNHYTRLAVQPWDAMEAWMTTDEFRGFLRGNALKYLARAGAKGDAATDYEKARHYLEKLIATYE